MDQVGTEPESLEHTTRILIVEDNEADFDLACALLDEIQGKSYRVDWARDFDSAIVELEAHTHNICLLDHRLGARTGIEFLEHKAASENPVPVIMLTGNTEREIDEAAMKAGAIDFLAKAHLNSELLERAIRYATERHRLLAELERMAQYDPLTGLANRALFRDFLTGAMARADRGERPLAIMFLDLDQFKYVNDSLGHEAGDHVLTQVAARLNECVRSGDLVARLGGDEFSIVLDDIGSAENAATVARNVLEALDEPVYVEEEALRAHASIGIAFYPNGVDGVDGLIKAGDTAMYEAKRNGRNTFRFYAPGMQQAAVALANTERELEKALHTNQLEMHFQPQLNAQTGVVIGMEGLIRWDDHAPAQFIPLAEKSGLIVPIGRFVLQRTCAQFWQWQERGLVDDKMRVSVNVSARQLADGDLVKTVGEVLERTGLPPTRLELELTETAMLDNPDAAQTVLDQFDRMGVRIAMDDFGTGYSSLTYLKRLPIRTLKIDRSFVNDIGVDPQTEAIIKATIGLSFSLGLDVIAEGVETAAQVAFLLANGCPVMQGFHFSKALPPAQMERFLRSRKTAGDYPTALSNESDLPLVVSVGTRSG